MVRRWFLSFAWLAAPAWAATPPEVPEVPEEALLSAPPDLRLAWIRQEEHIADLGREIEAARDAMVPREARDLVTLARRETAESLIEAEDFRAMARSEVEVTRLAWARARSALDVARRTAEDARRDVRLARAGEGQVDEARARLESALEAQAEAQRELAAARRIRDRIEREAEDQLVAADALAAAHEERLEERLSADDGLPTVTAEELALLVARRDLAAAELEREQAATAIASGARLELAPFEAAVTEAREAEAAARRAMHGGEEDDLEETPVDLLDPIDG